tara:strand:+ start:9395 stop:10909 length:1515 start_codon:yes stop_codon:yes gene_type:complete
MTNKLLLEKDIGVKLQAYEGKKIILSHGVFDLLHIGHIRHFESAKKLGDILIVSVTSDEFVNKGPGRPIFNHNLRANAISALSVVDAVIISQHPTAENIINIIKPDIYFKGPDYKINKKDLTKNIYKEIKAVKKHGGKIIYSNDQTFSSSNLINKTGAVFNEKQQKFLNQISIKYSFEYISRVIKNFEKLTPLVVGETIIDQYIFCEVLGKSGKEPHLVIKDDFKEDYLGGGGAIANHLSAFCKSVNFVSSIGDKDSYLGFIKKKTNSNIKINLINKKNSPTILKKRFIDSVSRNKLLGVYTINEEPFEKKDNQKLMNLIKKNSKKSDLIIVSDYGHGLISPINAEKISKLKKFICLNAQVNASNHGYHSLTKYKKIDTLLINENELRHEMRDKLTDIQALSLKLKKKFQIKSLVVTRGRSGALIITNNNEKVECPAFTNNIVDKVGAGDTMLAIISLCFKMNLPADLTIFLGSLAGAEAVENLGNSTNLNKNKIIRTIEYILK